MELSVNSDFIKDIGDVSPPLRAISETGFRYLHWCHHWADDYLYSYPEVIKIGRLLREYGLRLYDLHASQGVEKYWCSGDEAARLAGEELLLNRIRMTHDLGGRAIVLHPDAEPLSEKTRNKVEQGVKTLRALEPFCRELKIRIGMENLFDNRGESSFYALERYFSEFSPDYIGFCWDSGHANIVDRGMDKIEPLTARLLILHLNGNHGKRDEHLPVGEGTVDWERVARIIALSSYDGVLTQEVTMPQGGTALEFLKEVHRRGRALAAKIDGIREEGLGG